MSSRRRSKFVSPEIEQHFVDMMECLALESEAEIERLVKRRANKSRVELEKTGEVIFDLVVSDEVPGLGQLTLVTLRKRNQQQSLPWHRLKVGSPIVVFDQDHPSANQIAAVISRLRRDSLQVAVNHSLQGNRFCIELAADEITRQRQLQAITVAKDSRGRVGRMRDVLMGQTAPRFVAERACDFVAQLNPSQQSAVRFALSAEDLAIIHGPPGTGKTTTVVEVIIQAVRQGSKVLAVAPSNTAVDNLLDRLVAFRQRVVRLGHPARVSEALRDFTLDGLAEQHENTPIVQQMVREAEALLRDSAKWTRAKRSRQDRQELRGDAKQLLQQARQLERFTVEHILERADVVCSTTSVNDDLLGERWFDLIVLDEACQCTEPAAWVPLLRGEKLVLAGDHQQLPPTILSSKAIERGFAISLMERQVNLQGDQIHRLLQQQYRMHQQIMQFSSSQFYDDRLIADPTVAEHRLVDLAGVESNEFTECPVHLIDTAGSGFEDEQEADGFSKLNVGEARLTVAITRQLLSAGLLPHQLAIIAPYAAQVRLLRSMIHEEWEWPAKVAESSSNDSASPTIAITPTNSPSLSTTAASLPPLTELEIDTVDGFQGREKEAILISLVASNSRQEIGFLADTRRMNVALTRGRRKLIVIGDGATLASHPFYESFWKYAESINAYHSVWEYPDWL